MKKNILKLLFLSFFITYPAAPRQDPIVCLPFTQFELSPQFTRLAKHLYKSLNFSPFFNTKKLLDPAQIRKELSLPFQGGCNHTTVTTGDGVEIECTFCDRESDKLLIVGSGFGNEREKLAPFIHMFDSYDILLFDYRGHGYKGPGIIETSKLHIPRINPIKTTLGQCEEKDFFAAVNPFLQKKAYSGGVYGIALCFSSHIFAKVAAKKPSLFTKIIFDCSLHSIQDLTKRILNRPDLLIGGSAGSIMKHMPRWCKGLFSRFFSQSRAITNKTTGDYLAQVPHIPLLFFHARHDQVTEYKNDFKKNWDATTTPHKTAIIFDEKRHLVNHIKQKELWACIGNAFFELPHNEFNQMLQNPEKLAAYKQREIELTFRCCPS